MRSSAIVAIAAALAPVSLAFRNTSPLLIWSSEPNEALSGTQEEVTSGVIPAEEIYSTISSLGCDWETLVVGHVEDLHQTRISALQLPEKAADLHIPYLLRPSRDTLDSSVEDWARICGAEVHDSWKGLGEGKNVIKVDVKAGDDVFSLAPDIAQPYILILTGSPSLTKRQEAPLPSSTLSRPRPSSTSSQNVTLPTGPLLERVQLLTVPIITGLLVTFLLFIPILYIGISALLSIQVPPRMLEIGKGLSVGKDRKDQ